MLKTLNMRKADGAIVEFTYSTNVFYAAGAPFLTLWANFDEVLRDYPTLNEFRYCTYFTFETDETILNQISNLGFVDVRNPRDYFLFGGSSQHKTTVEFQQMGNWNLYRQYGYDNGGTPYSSVDVFVEKKVDNVYWKNAQLVGHLLGYSLTTTLLFPINYVDEEGNLYSCPSIECLGAPGPGTGYSMHFQFRPTSRDKTYYKPLYDYFWKEYDNTAPNLPPAETGGGDGVFDDDSDPIPIPDAPTIKNGFTSLWCPTPEQEKELSNWLWSTDILTELSRFFKDVTNSIVSCKILPVLPSNFSNANFTISSISSGITCRYTDERVVDLDCGEMFIEPYYGSFLDYTPYTTAQLYLPFVGYIPIEIDEIIKKNLGVHYRIDLSTGLFLVFVTINGNALYQYGGDCAYDVPLSSISMANTVQNVVGSLAAIVGSVISKNPAGVVSSAAGGVAGVLTTKPEINHASTVSSNTGWYGVPKPFLKINRTRAQYPENFSSLMGFPSSQYVKLADLKGYTVIKEIHLENMGLLKEELEEIESLLKGGVIF